MADATWHSNRVKTIVDTYEHPSTRRNPSRWAHILLPTKWLHMCCSLISKQVIHCTFYAHRE